MFLTIVLALIFVFIVIPFTISLTVGAYLIIKDKLSDLL